ncbi:MAG TPA: SIS domain-containing protein [Thermomicrobiales bacterium]|nr:SIS domain-containing protein [Thermomicrobiales bacterium]
MAQSGSSATRQRITALEETIESQPAAISEAIASNFETIRAAATLVAAARRVRLCGVGASWHAAMVGEHMLRSIGVDARVTHAFDLATYPTSFDPGELLIVISHRGGKTYSARALQRAAHAGLKTAAIVGRGGSLSGADATIETVDLERSSTHTASFTASMAVLAAIAARCEPRSSMAPAVASLQESVRTMLATRDTASEVAGVMTETDRRTLITGVYGNHAIARGGALAVKETAYLVVEGNHLEDGLHGGILGLNPGDVLIQLAPEGPADDRQADLAVVANAIGLQRWKIGGAPDGARWHSTLPSAPEIISPILTTIPLQWLALECALQRGTNPDVFRRDDERFDAAFSSISL